MRTIPSSRVARSGGALLAVPLLAAPLLSGCGAAVYKPRPSPRLAVTMEDGSQVLVKNGRTYSFNMFGGDLEEAVRGNAQAEEEARSYKSKTVTGFVLSTIGSVSSAVGVGVLVGNEVQSNPSTGVEIGSISAIVGGLLLNIVGGVVASGAQPHLWNAINMYNDGVSPAYPAWPQQPAYPGYPAAPRSAPPAYTPPGYAPPAYTPPAYTPPAYAPPPAAPAPPAYAPAPAPPAPAPAAPVPAAPGAAPTPPAPPR